MEIAVASETGISEEAMMRLFLSHERAVLRFILGYIPSLADARDVLQETAVTLWKKRDEYDTSRDFVPWACGIAKWKVREFWKKQPRWEAFASDDLLDRMQSRREALADQFSDRQARLERCLERLPDNQRRVLSNYYIESESVDSLARMENKTADAIYKLLQRMRRALLDCVEQGLKSEAAPAI